MAKILYALALLGCSLGMTALGALVVWRRRGREPVACRHAPFSRAILAALTGWAPLRHRLFDLKPLARAAVMESLSDAVLVFDARGRLADFNPAARRSLELAESAMGQAAGLVLGFWPELVAAIGHADEWQTCLAAQTHPPRFFDSRLSPLHDRDGGFCGQVLMLRDVTAQKAEEERYRLLLECNPLGMTVVENATGVIVYANRKAAELLEIPREQAIGSAAVAYYADPADHERTTSLYAQQGHLADYEVLLKSASGRTAWCLMTSNPTVFDGKPCNVSSIVDISERKRAEEALRFTQFVVDRMPDAVFWVTEAGRIFYVNESACQSLGYSRAELLAMTVTDIDPALPEGAWAAHWLALKEKGAMTFESQKKMQNGGIFPVEVRTNFVQFNHQEYACGIVRDITERKRAEEILRDKAKTEAVERQQRAILDHLPVGVMLTSGPEHKVLYQNPRFVAMFGYTHEQIPDAAHWWPLAYPDPDYRQSLIEQWQKQTAVALEKQTDFEPLEVTITARDGSSKQVGMHASAMDELFFITFIDLTERQQAEAARRERDAAEAASKAKSRFLANMSHEIRTPLNAILGFAQILERDASLDDAHRDKLATIRRSGEHLLELINDILDMAKIEAGNLSLRHRPFDLLRVTGEAESLFRQRARDRGLALIIEADGLPPLVNGDETKLRQVLINLLSNAVKFTREGSVTLRVKPQQDGNIRFSVADTGMGIAVEEMGRLFEPFTQTASGLKVQEGTGLGLAISRQFVRLMGGDLAVTSTPGEGSCFYFTLPLSAEETASAENEPPTPGLTLSRDAGPPAPARLSSSELVCRLAQCPPDWLAALRAALDCGDSNRVSRLVKQVRDQDAALHAALARWAYDCDHEAIIRALDGP